MGVRRRLVLAAVLPAIFASVHASRGAEAGSWDGTWKGMLGETPAWPISITISQGNVVSFSEKGVPVNIRYAKITPSTVYFGDKDHYSTKLTKTGDATASVRVHGRHGFATGSDAK
jgi:hypothetical protein